MKVNSQRLSITFSGQALGAIEEVGGHIFEGEAAREVLFQVVGVDTVEDHEAETHAVAAFHHEEGAFDLGFGGMEGRENEVDIYKVISRLMTSH